MHQSNVVSIHFIHLMFLWGFTFCFWFSQKNIKKLMSAWPLPLFCRHVSSHTLPRAKAQPWLIALTFLFLSLFSLFLSETSCLFVLMCDIDSDCHFLSHLPFGHLNRVKEVDWVDFYWKLSLLASYTVPTYHHSLIRCSKYAINNFYIEQMNPEKVASKNNPTDNQQHTLQLHAVSGCF